MTDNNTTIHNFDFKLISEYFSHLKRQGPGSPEATLKALSFIEDLTETSLISDIGCGTGGQTITLAENIPGQITGIDLFPTFINLFNDNVKKRKLDSRVHGVLGSMDNLPFKVEELDLIWSEGAIYNIGFEKGLNEWRKFLKKGAYIAVTEASWFTEKRPEEIDKYWKTAYPQIDTISNKVAQMQKAGYIPISSFILKENCWIENFYKPQAQVQETFLKKYKGNKTVEEFIAHERLEAELYTKYKDYYGYVFYIGRKF